MQVEIIKKNNLKAFDVHNNRSYPFQRYAVINSVNNPLINFRYFSSVQYIGLYDKKELQLLAPIRKYWHTNECSIVGSQECFDIVDCIYSESNPVVLSEAYSSLFRYLKSGGVKLIRWDWLPDDTGTKEALSILNINKEIKLECEPIYNVKIDLNAFHTYDDYNSTLSKSVRQNIRTAYNRLSRDGHQYRLNFFIGKESDRSKVKEALDLYLKGQKYRYDNFGFTHWLHFRFLHYVTRTMFEDFSFHASLEVDGTIVAMMQGYVDENRKAIQIPRLAIDPEYSFYSPGYVMICEVAKKMLEYKQYTVLDLMRGCEKYKFDLGGIAYPTYKCRIDL